MIAIVAQILVSLPIALDFKLFAFYDPGATLKVDWLISPAGGNLVPTQDFAYSYGLLSLEVGKLWLAATGRTPWAFWLYGSIGMLAMAAGLIRLANAISFSRIQKYMLLASLPLAIPAYYLSLTHVTEAALLIHALADQAKKKYSRALLLVTIAATLKPSMAYIYGFILVVMMVREHFRNRRHLCLGSEQSQGEFNANPKTELHCASIDPRHECLGLRRLTIPFIPATIAAIAICAMLAADFGLLPLIKTLLPITGGASYKAAGFGFFRAGQDFWLPENLAMLVFTPSMWWIASTIILWAAAIAVLIRMRRKQTVAGDESIITIALMHTAFIFLFFAWRDSWTYYAYLPAIGLAAAWNVFPLKRWSTVAVFVVIILSSMFRLSMTIGEWNFKSRTKDTAGLWVYEDQFTRWREVKDQYAQVMISRLSATLPTQQRPRNVYWLVNGSVEQMFPELHITTPPSWWLSPKLQNEKEMAAIRQGIAESDVVIRWAEHGRLDPWLYPEFTDLTSQFETIHRDEWFVVEKRR